MLAETTTSLTLGAFVPRFNANYKQQILQSTTKRGMGIHDMHTRFWP